MLLLLLVIISENGEIKTVPRADAPEHTSVPNEFESPSLTFKSCIYEGLNYAPITRFILLHSLCGSISVWTQF